MSRRTWAEAFSTAYERFCAQVDAGAPQLLDVRLVVRWGDERGQAMQWRTLRLAPRDINQAVMP